MTKNNKTEVLANKIAVFNNFFIGLQILVLGITVLFNFFFDDTSVIVTLFLHTTIFIVFNLFTGAIGTKYFDVRKVYESVLKIAGWRHLKMTIETYKFAKSYGDIIMKKLIEQKIVKLGLWIVNLVLVILLVEKIS